MSDLKLYRKRFIPEECFLLKDDVIVYHDEEKIITTWQTFHPKLDFSHGSSCYFLKQGFKVSKFYRPDNTLLYWYCDIVDFETAPDGGIISVDLLADVIIYPDGKYKVLDLDELADAYKQNLIDKERLDKCLHRLNNLLSILYQDRFDRLASCLDQRNI